MATATIAGKNKPAELPPPQHTVTICPPSVNRPNCIDNSAYPTQSTRPTPKSRRRGGTNGENQKTLVFQWVQGVYYEKRSSWQEQKIMAVTSTSGTQAVTQAAWQLLQLQQAKQFAERAAQNARTLQAKANDAQNQADRAQESARTVRVDANQAQSVAIEADRGVRATESSSQIGPQIVNKVTQTVQAQVAATEVQAQTPPTVNTQGEAIGTVINVTA
ncbi:MAG: hypothetical protein M0P59_05065 [Gallionella sp.]|jgi:hypothetical protein|nr:hypothetical protein [Gallionella sp.]MCK9353513.1 hypothetical protein [Gallionella sp.]